MDLVERTVDTGDRILVDLTEDLVDFCQGRGDGLASAFCPHATAALILMEHGSGSDEDLVAWMRRQLSADFPYRHRRGHPGHGADHLVPALFGASVTVPVRAGTPLLGTWQSLLLLDPNSDSNRRRVLFSFVG